MDLLLSPHSHSSTMIAVLQMTKMWCKVVQELAEVHKVSEWENQVNEPMHELQALLSQLFHYSASPNSSNYKDCLNYAYVFFDHLLAAEIG